MRGQTAHPFRTECAHTVSWIEARKNAERENAKSVLFSCPDSGFIQNTHIHTHKQTQSHLFLPRDAPHAMEFAQIEKYTGKTYFLFEIRSARNCLYLNETLN